MINLSLNKQLDIIVPNKNRALATILQQATPKELETLSKDKDLGSIMNSLLKESSQNSASDKTLLDLAKNNPTLKELGNISGTIKDLLSTLKSEKNPLPIETTLKNFLLEMKDISEPILREKFENSGVFLESKLKNVQNPQLELKTLLQGLEKNLAKSDFPVAKMLSEKIKDLLATPTLKEASNDSLPKTPKDDASALKQLSKGVESIVLKLRETLGRGDVVNSKGFEMQLSKLEHLITPKLLTHENFKLPLLQDTLAQLNSQLMQSSKPEVKGLLDTLGKIIESLKGATLDELNAKKIPQSISAVIESAKAVIEKSDSLFSKETATIGSKLDTFKEPQKLFVQENVREILSKDLKALLLQAGDEISRSSHPNQAEISKHVDKLLLQIDYYQLTSHLSNSSSLYLPFSWDGLEEGNINLKKDKDDKFYCDIDLKLKEYGELKLKLTLYEKNQINIHIYSNNNDFKGIIKENIHLLRSALIESQITPREIRLFEAVKKSSPYDNQNSDIQLGFEVKA